MNSEWPVRSDAPRVPTRRRMALQRRDSHARRLADAATDLFVDPLHRISDRIRATASAMVDDLVDDIERMMRARLSPEFQGLLGVRLDAVAVPLLRETRLLADPPLIAAVMRRAEASVLADRVAPARDGSGLPLDDPDHGVAADAAALLVAEARRLDRFGAPVLPFDDVAAEVAHRLVWRIAAVLRHYLRESEEIEGAAVDKALAEAAVAVLGVHDEGQALDAIAMRLASRLRANDRLDGRLLAGWLEAGQVAAFNAGLAFIAGLPNEEVWHIVADPADGRLALALRAAGVGREPAAAILLMLLPANADASAEIDLYNACDADEAADALAPLTTDPDLRAASDALDAALGARDAA